MLEVIVCLTEDSFPFFSLKLPGQGGEEYGPGPGLFLDITVFSLLTTVLSLSLWIWVYLATSLISTRPLSFTWWDGSLPKASLPVIQTSQHHCSILQIPLLTVKTEGQAIFPDWQVIESPSSEINATIRGSEDHQLSVTFSLLLLHGCFHVILLMDLTETTQTPGFRNNLL